MSSSQPWNHIRTSNTKLTEQVTFIYLHICNKKIIEKERVISKGAGREEKRGNDVIIFYFSILKNKKSDSKYKYVLILFCEYYIFLFKQISLCIPCVFWPTVKSTIELIIFINNDRHRFGVLAEQLLFLQKTEFDFQHQYWVAHNCLTLQLQRIWCQFLASVGYTCAMHSLF